MYKPGTCNNVYCTSGNFPDDLIFVFDMITFTSQNIQYAETLSNTVCYDKLF